MVSLLVATDVGEGLHSRLVGFCSANAKARSMGAAPRGAWNGWVRVLAATSLMAYRPFPDAKPGSDNADDDDDDDSRV